jgi:hypothetical protein
MYVWFLCLGSISSAKSARLLYHYLHESLHLPSFTLDFEYNLREEFPILLMLPEIPHPLQDSWESPALPAPVRTYLSELWQHQSEPPGALPEVKTLSGMGP